VSVSRKTVGKHQRRADPSAAAAKVADSRNGMLAGGAAAMLAVERADGRIVEANPAAAILFERPAGALTAITLRDLAKQEPGGIARAMAKALGRSQDHFALQHRLASGELRELEIHVGPMTIDGRTLDLWVIRDITERALRQKEVEEKTKALQLVLDNMDQGLSMVDADLNGIASNRKFYELLDLPPEMRQQDNRYEDFIRYNAKRGEYGPGEVEQLVRERVALAKQFKPHCFERERPDGTIIEVRGTPLPDGGFISIYSDITERKRAETLNTRLGRIIEDSANEIYVFDGTTLRFVTVNRGARDNLGYSMDELAKLTPVDLKPEYTAADFAAMIEPLRDGSQNTLSFDTVHQRKDGSTYPVEVRLQLARNENPPVFFAIISDITEKRRGESALREAVALQQNLLDHSPTLIAIRDLDGRFRLINRAYERVFDVKREDIEGKAPADVVPGAFAAQLKEFDQTVIETGKPLTHEHDAVFIDGPGTLLSVRFPVRRADGQLAGVGSIGVDVTERKRAELALQAAMEDAELANRAKTEFLANMSHELRTPLNAIIGFSQIMEQGLHGPLPDKYRRYAQDILESGQHLSNLLGDILDLSKIEAAKYELQEQAIDLAEANAACLRLVDERLAGSGLKLTSRFPKTLPALYGDATAIKQVILNLLTNAIKFTPEGGAVAVRGGKDRKGSIWLRVADTGVGMSETGISVALTAFGQVAGHLTRKHEGTGLGLPLIKSLIELHGGTLEIDSAVGHGTKVTVRFPPERTMAARRRPNAA
jgi:two-component system cell cycle sensor histidine kinase PleC